MRKHAKKPPSTGGGKAAVRATGDIEKWRRDTEANRTRLERIRSEGRPAQRRVAGALLEKIVDPFLADLLAIASPTLRLPPILDHPRRGPRLPRGTVDAEWRADFLSDAARKVTWIGRRVDAIETKDRYGSGKRAGHVAWRRDVAALVEQMRAEASGTFETSSKELAQVVLAHRGRRPRQHPGRCEAPRRRRRGEGHGPQRVPR
jgi:hypothetical protein